MTDQHKTPGAMTLLSCPFCGGEPSLTHDHYVHDDLRPMPTVECKSCSAWVRVEDWNRRAQRAAQPNDDLLARFPEINFSNYGQQEVEALQAWAFEALDQIQAASLTDKQQRQAIELLNLADHALSHASLNSAGDVVEHTQDRRDHMRVQIIVFLKALDNMRLAAPVEQDEESATCAKSQVELQLVEYQYRTRPTWCEEGRGWTDWTRCSAGAYADYNKTPLLHDWQYETRALHCNAGPSAAAKVFDPCEWTDREVLDFLGCALRNVDIVGEVRMSEIRQGFQYMRDRRAKS